MYEDDAGYLCWLREARLKDNGDKRYFDLEVNALLDFTIRNDSSLSKFTIWGPEIDITPTAAADALAETSNTPDAYESWGQF